MNSTENEGNEINNEVNGNITNESNENVNQANNTIKRNIENVEERPRSGSISKRINDFPVEGLRKRKRLKSTLLSLVRDYKINYLVPKALVTKVIT